MTVSAGAYSGRPYEPGLVTTNPEALASQVQEVWFVQCVLLYVALVVKFYQSHKHLKTKVSLHVLTVSLFLRCCKKP